MKVQEVVKWGAAGKRKGSRSAATKGLRLQEASGVTASVKSFLCPLCGEWTGAASSSALVVQPLGAHGPSLEGSPSPEPDFQ